MQKDSRLLLVQVDHVSGEVLGFAVERIMQLGAHNVQLLPTVTKKNRPGNIIIIDSGSEREEAIALFLAQELKVSGYHRINTEHVFHKVSFREKTLVLSENGRLHETRCRFKVMGELESPVAVDVEHDFLVGLQRELSEGWERYFSLEELRSKVELSYSDVDDVIKVTL